jgi:hypothetical protein
MRLRNKRAWILAGLAALGATVVGGHNAQASSIAQGIVIKGSGGTVPGTDPIFYYDFQVFVAAGYQMNTLDYFQFQNLPGVTAAGVLPTPPGSLGSTYTTNTSYFFATPVIYLTGSPTGGATSPYDPTNTYTSNVNWEYVGATPIPGGTLIGSFIIDTSVELTSLLTTVTYVAQSHDSSTGDPFVQGPGGNAPAGNFVLTIPEPSSLTLLLLGGVGPLPLLLICERRRRQRRNQDQSQSQAA